MLYLTIADEVASSKLAEFVFLEAEHSSGILQPNFG
jgi:hypothetical protein